MDISTLARAPTWERLRRRLAAALVEKVRLQWAVRVRWLTVAGFLVLALAAYAGGVFVSVTAPLLIGAVAGGLNAINDWCVRRQRFVSLVSAVAIPADLVLITMLVARTGGPLSPFVVLYVVAVLATAMLVDTLVAAAAAVLAVCLWGIAVGLHRLEWIPFSGLQVGPDSPWFLATWGAFLCYCLMLLVYLGGYISECLRVSERNLAERNLRLQETISSVRRAHAELQSACTRLRATEVQLIHSEKLRGLGQLVAGVAHELNNPISFVAGNVDHLHDYARRLTQMLTAYAAADVGDAPDADLRRQWRDLKIDTVLADLPGLLADCREGAQRVRDIVRELRAFARSDDGAAWQRVDLRRGIESTLGLLGHRLRPKIQVHHDLGELPEVECLPGQINQVFMNLFANAIDAIGERPGNIWIRAVREPESEPAHLCVEVCDDGCGIPEATLGRIFEPFFTTKPVGQGTGLGLSVSYGIIARHHGHIEVWSRPGTGTRVCLRLPVSQPAESAPGEPASVVLRSAIDESGIKESRLRGATAGGCATSVPAVGDT